MKGREAEGRCRKAYFGSHLFSVFPFGLEAQYQAYYAAYYKQQAQTPGTSKAGAANPAAPMASGTAWFQV